MLQPSNQWQWQFNQTDNQLLLDIDSSMAFTTAYKQKHLTNEIFNDTSFNLDDADYYQKISSELQDLGYWSTPEVVQIALNATAAQRYYKPTMPKSWFFKTNQTDIHLNSPSKQPQTTCLLYTERGYGRFLVVEHGDCASVCMLLDESLLLTDSKELNQFDIIKVMNDRVFGNCDIKQLKYA
jgi:cell division protein ZapC